MRIYSLKIFDYYPLWKKWRVDRYESSHTISLLVGLFGLISSFWTITVWFTSTFNQSLRESIALEDQFITSHLSEFFISLVYSFIIGVIILIAMVLVNDNINQITIKSHFRDFKEIVFQTVSLKFKEVVENEIVSEKEITKVTRNYIILYVSITFTLGFAAGAYYSFIYYIPYFMIYILFAFIFSLLFNSINIALPLAMLITWLMFIWWIIKGKLYKEVTEKKEINYQQNFHYSNRTYEILASKKEAIICSSCRSYISANSINCRVCGDKIKVD